MKFPGVNRRFGFIALIVFAVLAPFIFFSSPMRPLESESTRVTFLQELLYPVSWLWHRSAGVASSVWTSYIDLRHAAEENMALRSEITRLRTRTLDYDEQLQQVDRLRELLGFTQGYGKPLVVAEVIGGKRATPFKALRISKGSSSGVRLGMPVVGSEGVVGRVVRVGQFMADVQLLVDFDFNLDVLMQRTRVRGVLKGYAGEGCRLYLQRGTEVRIGDTIITSGIVGGFPKGIPVGRVIRISYESDNVSQIITVEPWADHRRLDEVVVLLIDDPDLQKIVETAGPEWLDGKLADGTDVHRGL